MVLLGDWMAGEVGWEVTEWTLGSRRTESHGRQVGPLSMCQGLHGLELKSYLETGLTIRPFFQAHLGGSVVEQRPSAQYTILGPWDQVLYQLPRREPVSPSACVSASLSLCVSHE